MNKIPFSLRLTTLLLAVLAPLAALHAQSNYATPYTFTTLAGNAGYGSADGTGSAARFYNPYGDAVDSAGNVYVADTYNSTIRKITSGGVVTTLAGMAGSTGSADGTGSAARFNTPSGVAVDSAGNVYVADKNNETIRKITSGGVVTTLAGMAGSTGSADGTGSAARFNTPFGIAVDSAGNVYVADQGNSTIRKITSGGVVTTLAGTAGLTGAADGTGSAAQFYDPSSVAVDSAGNVYVTDVINQTIRKITSGGVVTTLAGTAGSTGSADGTGSAARFRNPYGVTVDISGNVYVADQSNSTIRKITSGGVVTTLAGTAGSSGSADGTGSAARFYVPFCVAVDSAGNIYVADTYNSTIRKITSGGVVTTFAGLAGGPGSADGTGSAAQFKNPIGVAVDSAGNVYVGDQSNRTIRKLTSGGVVTTLAGSAGSSGSADGTGSAARFAAPSGVAVDSAGNVYVADVSNSTIRKITSGGVVTTLAGSAGSTGSADGTGSAARFYHPQGVAVDSAGNVYVADYGNSTIRKITSGGVVTTLAGSAGNSGSADGTGSAARFGSPFGVTVDSAGNIYVVDQGNSTIRQITSGGVVTTLAGLAGNYGSTDGTGSAARFSNPFGVAVDSAGNVYVADTYNSTIRKITSGGVVTTLAGLAANSGSADGTGSATRFNQPYGVAVDSAGNVYVADYGNNTIRMGVPALLLTSAATASGTVGQSFTYTATFTDSPTSYSASGLPYGLTIDPGTGIISGTPAIAGTFPVTLGATNVGGTNTATLTLTIAKGTATISLSGLSATYDGTAKSVLTSAPAVVTTLAGMAGSTGSSDGTGSAARFNYPPGVAVDVAGNVYVADQINSTIRKITSGGVVTTLAGSAGSIGSADGTGSAARFNYPYGVAVDSAGNVYVADDGNSTIRKITSGGVVTTLAGSAGSTGSTDGTGSAARFNYPRSVAVDSAGNVYVADTDNFTIRKITSGGVVTTLAGSASNLGSTDGTGSAARFNDPYGVAVDSAGNVYVADTGNSTIRKITSGGVVTTLAGLAGVQGSADGTGSAARFATLLGIAVDSVGNVYVGDDGFYTIRKITSGGIVTTLAGLASNPGSTDGTGSAARFNDPYGVAVDSAGNVYVADESNSTIRKITQLNNTVSVTYNGSSTAPTAPGSYTVVATLSDPNYQGTATGTLIIASAGPALTTQPQSQYVGLGGTVTFSAAAPSFPTPTYQWYKNGTLINGATNATLTLTNIQRSDTGSYTVVATTAGGSTTSTAAVLRVTPDISRDFNNDGHADIVWQNASTGDRGFWLMNGTTVSSWVDLGIVSTDWRIAATADFNGDGKPDFLWENTVTGDRGFWLMNGTSYASWVDLGVVSTDWRIAGAGDFNGDGQTDIVWENTVTGDRGLWLMNGTSFASWVDIDGLSTDWRIAAVGDFNGDGQPDIVLENTVTGDHGFWLMNGTSYGSWVSLGNVSPDWQITGVGDFNGDGKMDILWENTVTGDRGFWLMNGTAYSSWVDLGYISPEWSIAN